MSRSHTSSAQWQSFEMRMRRRRAERCALRAEVALEAGFPEDAREALDEARRLDPSVADFDALQAVVVEREALRREERALEQRARKARRNRRLSVAAAVLLASAGISAWLVAREPVSGSRVPVPGSVVQGSLVPASTLTRYDGQSDPSAVALAEAEPQVPSPDLSAVASAKAEPRVPSPDTRVPSSEPRTQNPEPRTGNREPGTWNREREEPPPLPSATILTDITLPTVSRPEPPLPALAQPVSDAGPPPTSAPPAAATAPTVADEGPRVRAALGRYEAAYSALSVSATQDVWPGVNARSLARAFEGLESQRLSLGNCTVAIDGAGARAECNGTATWTPRIGGGSRTEPRNWRFELKNAAGEWQIVRAEAR